jgi:Predicted phosphosugar isomerases
MPAIKNESLKLPWSSSEYETWLKQFDKKKSEGIEYYIGNAISKWHANFEDFYGKSEYTHASKSQEEKHAVTSVVFCARGGAAFSCNLARYYLNNCSSKKMKSLHKEIKNDSQNIEYDQNALYVFVTYSGNTEEILNSYENLLKNYKNANKDGSKSLHVLIVTSQPDHATTGAGSPNLNQIMKKMESVLLEHPKSSYDLHLVALPNTAFYRDTHSIQPYLLFSGTMKGISQYFSLNKKSNGKNFEEELFNNILEIRTNKRMIEQINSSVIKAAKILEKQIPYIYSDSNTGIIAERMQHVINENAKILTATGSLSDIQHNHVIPWTQGRSCESVPVFLPSDDKESIRNTQIIETKLSSDQIKLPYYTFELFKDIHDNNKKLFIGLYAADLLSVRLSMLNGADPSDNSEIYVMKKDYSGHLLENNY